MRKLCGYTLIELVAVIVIAGILVALAAPRFIDQSAFERRGFYDQVISALRYAHKVAIAQNRYVCVGFGTNSVTLKYDSTSACASNLEGPDGQSPYSISSSNASFSSIPAGFYFDALGRPFNASGTSAQQTVNIANVANSITVEAETGYVH